MQCEATAMDYALLGSSDPVEPCNGVATCDRRGYHLCLGCAEALDALIGALGEACIRHKSTAASFAPITQTEFSDPAADTHGNCLSACLEAITGIHPIPNFANFGRNEWFTKLWEWSDSKGWDVYSCNQAKLPITPTIVQGDGPRGFKHACIWVGGPNGMLAWDPHPSRAGLLTYDNWVRVTPQPRTT